MSYLTPAEIAALLRVDISTVQRWIRIGELPAIRAGRQYRVERTEYERFVAERSMPAPQKETLAYAG